MTKLRTSRRTVIKTLGAGTALAAGGLGFPAIVQAQDKIKLGLIVEMSAHMTLLGTDMLNCVKLAVEEINEQGGAGGREIVIVAEDAQFQTKVAIDKARKLIFGDKVDLLVGTIASFIRVAVLSVSKPAGKLFIYPTFYEGGECDPSLVVTGALPNQSVDPMVPWLFENVGKSVYVMGSDYIYPRGMADKIKVAIEGLGGRFAGAEFYPFSTRDYAPLLQKAAATRPDMVWVMDGSAPDTFVRQYREFNMKPQLVSTIMNENLAIPLEGAAEGELLNSSYFSSLDTPENLRFIKRYRERFGDAIYPMSYAESAYAGVWLYAKAVEKANSLDNDKVVKALAQVDFQAPQGRVNIFARNQHMRANSIVGRVRKDGLIDVVEKFGQIDPVTADCNLA